MSVCGGAKFLDMSEQWTIVTPGYDEWSGRAETEAAFECEYTVRAEMSAFRI